MNASKRWSPRLLIGGILGVFLAMPAALGAEWLIAFIKGEPLKVEPGNLILATTAFVLIGTLLVTWSHARARGDALYLVQACLGLAVTGLAVPRWSGDFVGNDQWPRFAVMTLGLAVLGTAIAELTPWGRGRQTRSEFVKRVATAPLATSRTRDERIVSPGGAAIRVRLFGETEPDDFLRQTFLEVVGTDGFDFLAYYVNNVCHLLVDSLDTDSLRRYSVHDSPEVSREKLERAGRQVSILLSGIDIGASEIDRGVLVKASLDLQSGSLIYCKLSKEDHLIGVTVQQANFAKIESLMLQLHSKVAMTLRPLQR